MRVLSAARARIAALEAENAALGDRQGVSLSWTLRGARFMASGIGTYATRIKPTVSADYAANPFRDFSPGRRPVGG